MFRGNRKRLSESERVKFKYFIGGIFVDFIDDENHGLFAAAENIRHIVIGRRKPLPSVREEQNDVRRIDGDVRLLCDFLPHHVVRFELDTARIHHRKMLSPPFPVCIQPVARDARAVFRNGDLPSRHFIEKCTFSHIGPPHKGNQRVRHNISFVLPNHYTVFRGFCKEKKRQFPKESRFSLVFSDTQNAFMTPNTQPNT